MSDTPADDPNTAYDAAIAVKDSGDLEKAVEQLLAIVEKHPDHVLSHSALAVSMQKIGKPEEAVAHAKKVTEIEPNDPFSFTQLSVICQRCGLIPEAEDAMAHARAIQGG
ncbi:MAG: hypothetical protein AAF532_05575 [Planctomycetota bacterium]